jgi:hypothetical protein
MDLMGSGLLILSRFPIEEWYFKAYKNLNGIDGVTYKGVLGVVIDCDENGGETISPKSSGNGNGANEEERKMRRSSKSEKAKRMAEEKQPRDEKKQKGDVPRNSKRLHLLRLFLTHCQAQNDAESSRSRERNWQQMAHLTEKFRPDVAMGTVLMGDMNTCYTIESDAEYVSMKRIFMEYATGLPERPMEEKLNGGENEQLGEKEVILKVNNNDSNVDAAIISTPVDDEKKEIPSVEPVIKASRFPSNAEQFTFIPTIDPLNNVLARIFESSKIQIADFILYKDLTPVLSSRVVTDWKLDDGDDCSDHYPVLSTFSFLT